MENNTVQPFNVYPLGTVDKNQYPVINLKDLSKKHTYLILDKLNNKYFKTTSLGSIKQWLKMHYGYSINMEVSNELHYVSCGRYEQLLPDSIVVSDDYDLIAKVQLKVNLKYSETQHILKKEGIVL